MYNFIEYSDNYSETTGSLWQYCKCEQRNLMTDYNPLKFKSKFLANTNKRGIINVEIALLLKYLSNFWRTFEIPLIN